MLKSLGFAKKRAPSELQTKKHRDQMLTHNQWKNDVAKIRAVTGKLENAYGHHKGDFALGRYEELKDMIKGAIKEYGELMQKTQKHPMDGAAAAIANKYRTGQSSQSYQSTANTESGAHKSEGILSKIKKHAAALTGSTSSSSGTANGAAATPMSKQDAKDQEMLTWGYEGMSAKQVEEETEKMRKEVLTYKQEFRRERDRLDRLAKEYEDSKKHAPPQRYTVLKYMIKDAVTRN